MACPHQQLQIVTTHLSTEDDSGVLPMIMSVPLDAIVDLSIAVNVTDLPTEEKLSSTFSILNVTEEVIDSVVPAIYSKLNKVHKI